jgi:hypothetical protein
MSTRFASNAANNLTATIPWPADRTFATWVYRVASSSWETLAQLDNTNRQVLYISGGSDVLTLYINGAQVAAAQVPVGRWMHVAAVNTGLQFTLYQNGIQTGSGTTPSAQTWANLRVGSNAIWSEPCDARVAHMMAWGRVLSATEIRQQMYRAMPLQRAGLLGWWPLLSDRTRDYSGAGVHLTQAGTLTNEEPPPVAWAPTVWAIPWVEAGGGGGVTGDASVTLGALTAAGAGTVAVAGAGAATLGSLTATGAGIVAITGASAPSVGALAVAGAGTVAIAGAASVTLGAVTVSSAGTIGAAPVEGTAVIALGALTNTASGVVSVVGSAAMTLGALAGSGAGAVAIAGASAKTLGALTVIAAGTVAIAGAASATLGTVTVTAAGAVGTVPIAGAATIALGALSVSGAGVVAVVGAGAATLGALTLGAFGGSGTGGEAVISFGALTLNAIGVVVVTGAGEIALGAITGAAAGSVLVTATGAAALGTLTSEGAGVIAITGAASVALGAVTLTGAGYSEAPGDANGTADIVLGGLTAAGVVVVLFVATFGRVTGPGARGNTAGASGVGTVPGPRESNR